jgi:hypothetical protein
MQMRTWNTLHGTMAVHSVILGVESVVAKRAKKDSFDAFDENSRACKVVRSIPTTKYN